MKILLTFILTFLPFQLIAEDFIIYSIAHEIPMGVANESLKKNYYINIGKNQGIQSGAVLNVYRMISRQDPYENKKRFRYRVPIGKVKVIHSEQEASIAVKEQIAAEVESKNLLFEIDKFMIGDIVAVDVN